MKLRVKELCEKQGISLSKMAIKMGVARETLSRQINETANPTINTLADMAGVLNVEVSDLFTDNKITGAIRVGDVLHTIDSKEDIERLLIELRYSQK